MSASSLEAEAALENLKAALLNDKEASKLARIENSHKKELALLEKNRQEVLANTAIEEEEKQAKPV